MSYTTLPSPEVISTTAEALKKNNIDVIVAKNADEAKQKIFEMIPEGSQVMTMISETLETLGIAKEINESGKYESVKKKLAELPAGREKRQLGAAPDIAIGSVHAVTQDGKVIVASNSGSQMPGYVYGAGKVIWVVGTHKIAKDLDEGIKRIYEHTLPLESERAKKAYGMPGSFVSKMLIFNRESAKDRITLVFIPEVLGY
jgi:acyl-CoA hydrolase